METEIKESEEKFEPKIVAFCCNWCSYAGADLAGVSRMQYPPNIRIVRLMCSARLDPIMVSKAFSYGADGVLILACHIGDCHYLTGNHRAVKKSAVLKKILGYLGINPNRVRFDFVSAAEGGIFAQIVTDFTDEIRKLGPNPLKVKP